MTVVLLGIKLGVRFLIFGIAMVIAHKKIKKFEITPWYAIPLVALVFALLNTALYYVLTETINLASFQAFAFVAPVVVNGLFLHLTAKLLSPLRIDGWLALVKMAVILSLLTGAISFGFDKFA